MKRIQVLLATLLLLLTLPTLALADTGRGGKFILGENYVLEAGEELYGDLVVMGGSARLEEKSVVHGNVVVMGGATTVAGTVKGDVTVFGGSVNLKSTAVVEGEVMAIGGSILNEGADVRGEIVEGRGPWEMPFMPHLAAAARAWSPWSLIRQIASAILTMMALMALGVLVVLLLPQPTEQVIQVILSAPWASIGVGLLTLVILPVVALLLIITCIGPFILGLAAGIALLFGWLAVGLLIGRRILEGLGVKEISPLVAVIVGVSVITLLAKVPCIGWLFALALVSLGLGAVVLTRFGTTPYPWPSSSSGPSPTRRLVASDLQENAEGHGSE